MVNIEAMNSAVFFEVKNWPYLLRSFLGIDSTKAEVILYAVFKEFTVCIKQLDLATKLQNIFEKNIFICNFLWFIHVEFVMIKAIEKFLIFVALKRYCFFNLVIRFHDNKNLQNLTK